MTLEEYKAYLDEQLRLFKKVLKVAADKAIARLEEEQRAFFEQALAQRRQSFEQANQEAIQRFEADMAELQQQRQGMTHPSLLKFMDMREENLKQMLASNLAFNKKLLDDFIKQYGK